MSDKRVNISMESVDVRSVSRIIFEKAAFGAVPMEFKIDSHPDWHTIRWMEHPGLHAIRFSDGTISYVSGGAKAHREEAEDSFRNHQGLTTERPMATIAGKIDSKLEYQSDDDAFADTENDRLVDALKESEREREFDAGLNDAIDDSIGKSIREMSNFNPNKE